jgi:hypothetical protein
MQRESTILQHLSRALHVRLDDITHEPLPQGWVDLINYLNEQERSGMSNHERRGKGGRKKE